jgi:CRP-like cAMP-binding protein
MFEEIRQHIHTISPIEDSDWEMVEPHLRQKHFKKNEFYFQAGSIENQIAFISQGSFKWYYLNKKGSEIIMHFSFENEFIVEFQSFITQKPSSLFLQAMEDSTVVLFPKRDLILNYYKLSHNWSEVSRKIAQEVYVFTAERVQDFLIRSAEERYLNLLKRHPDIFNRVSLANLASYIGIAGPSLSRIRRRLSQKELVRMPK